MGDTSQENGHGGIGVKDLAAIVDSARRAAEAAADSARATQQIADDLRAILETRRRAGMLTGSAPIATAAQPLDPNLEIVIVAAVAAALQGRAFAVRHVQLADKPSLAWSQIGRTRIHTSHSIEKRS